MKFHFSSLIYIGILVSLVSCHSSKQSTSSTASIIGKHWKLVELNGEVIRPNPQTKKEPFMNLTAENKVNGNGGCNSFFGTYEFQSDNAITFSKIGSTKMACQDDVMRVEYQFFQALEKTSRYSFKNDTLVLAKFDVVPVAKFVVGQ